MAEEAAVFQDPATPEQRLNKLVFEALGAASTCWTPGTGDAVFDSTRAKEIGEGLVEDIKFAVPSVLREPFLGYATTKQLIDELHARAEVSATIREAWPSYRTAGNS
jgi:hypothetical protein